MLKWILIRRETINQLKLYAVYVIILNTWRIVDLRVSDTGVVEREERIFSHRLIATSRNPNLGTQFKSNKIFVLLLFLDTYIISVLVQVFGQNVLTDFSLFSEHLGSAPNPLVLDVKFQKIWNNCYVPLIRFFFN